MEKEERFIAIENLLKMLTNPLVVVDAGARWGFQEHWKRIESLVQLIGVDADEQEIKSLNTASQSEEFIPKVLGAQNGYAEFYVTQDPACSSLYPPDKKLIRARPSMYVANLVSKEEVQITTLDSWMQSKGISKVDFIKLDVQGAELDILKGATKTLPTIRMLEVEIQFNPLYQGVPLFGDVDRFLRECGFSLWRIKNLCHYGLSESSVSITTDEEIKYDYFTKRFKGRNGQLYWGDAFYVREEVAYNDSRPWELALQDACMAGILGFEDLFFSSLKNALATCPASIKEEIKSCFLHNTNILKVLETDSMFLETAPSQQIGLGLHDEYAEIEQLQSKLETANFERDQALKQLDAFYHSRSFKLVSFIKAVYSFFLSKKKNVI